MSKVMISCPVNERKAYCLDEYFNNILNYSYPNVQFYFSDNSTDETYHLKLMAQYGFEIDYISPKHLSAPMYMCQSMNQILKKFLASDCTHLLLNECDVFGKKDIIEQLLSHNKDIVGVSYFINTGYDAEITQFNIDKFAGTNNSNTSFKGEYLEFDGKIKKVDTVGFGCTLIKREVLEGYKFYIDAIRKVHCDTTFALDMCERSVDIYRDDYILCEHKNQDWSTISDY